MNELNNGTLVMSGEAIKALPDGRIGGYGIVFGSAHLTDRAGDWFTPDTYLGPSDGDGVDCLLHHSLSLRKYPQLASLRDGILTRVSARRDEYGIYIELQLDLDIPAQAALYDLVRAGGWGFSSGSAEHMVRYAEGIGNRGVDELGRPVGGEIVSWPVVEFSLTPTPCETRARATALKTLEDAVLPTAAEVMGDAALQREMRALVMIELQRELIRAQMEVLRLTL